MWRTARTRNTGRFLLALSRSLPCVRVLLMALVLAAIHCPQAWFPPSVQDRCAQFTIGDLRKAAGRMVKVQTLYRGPVAQATANVAVTWLQLTRRAAK